MTAHFSFLYQWLMFIKKYQGSVRHTHEDKVVAFLCGEINGAELGVETMTLLLEYDPATVVDALSANKRGTLYLLLVTIMKGVDGYVDDKGIKESVLSSSSPHWQNFHKSIVDPDEEGLFVSFIAQIGLALQNCGSEAVNACLSMTNQKSRDQNQQYPEQMKSIVQLGPVRGTFGVQLLGAFGRAPG